MNNDLYYFKYIKYKQKYLEEKNKIGGACDLQKMKKNFNQLSPINQAIELFKNITNEENIIENIIEKIINIYDTIVIPLKDKKKYTKDCLKEVLTNYLNLKKNDIDKKEYSTFKINNITYESLNIEEDTDIFFKKNIVENTEFSRGTALIFKEYKGVYVRNLRYLTNLFNIKFKIDNNTYIESLRFGTPYVPNSDNVKKINKILDQKQKEPFLDEIKNFYDSQIEILKEYIGNKKCIFISLLDICDSKILCAEKLVGEKVIENEIIHKEITGYSSSKNIVYLSMPCNNSVNLTDNISVISQEDLVPKLEAYFSVLDGWLETNSILQALKNNGGFFEKFKNNVLKNNSLDEELLKKLSIRRFVLIENTKKSGNIGTLKNFIDHDMEKLSPCLEDLTNENIRLVMFCYISLIFYILSKNNPKEYILLYHCKSGQDRTGTFMAVNQMVNEITKNNYDNIISKIVDEKEKKAFIDIFIEFYSLTPTEYIEKDIIKKYEKKFCPITPKNNLGSLNEKINKNVELCYLQNLLFSYIITITSTGCPGLKWSLINKNIFFKLIDKRRYNTGSSISNRFPYLLLSNPFYALLFEGASEMRGT